MEEELIDVPVMRSFAGIHLVQGSLPDEGTILGFSHLLGEKNLAETIFKVVREHLAEQGLSMKQGTIVDASIINAPSSTKNKEKQDDLDMDQTRKGNQWFFGIKVHIGLDKNSGLIHAVVTSAANVHEVILTADLLHGEGEEVNGDGGYQGLERREEMAGRIVECRIAMRPDQRRKLSDSTYETTVWLYIQY